MPTPTGLPTKGDRIRHVESGTCFIVVKRLGNTNMYSVIARREDGHQHPGRHAFGYPPDHALLTEMAWMFQQKLFVLEPSS